MKAQSFNLICHLLITKYKPPNGPGVSSSPPAPHGVSGFRAIHLVKGPSGTTHLVETGCLNCITLTAQYFD